MLLGIPVYHHVNLLDVTGPLEMFFWAKEVGKAHLDTVILSEDGGPVTSINGVRFHAQASFAEKPKLDVLWVPGAGDKVIGSMLRDPDSRYLNYLRQVAEDAKWVCSVCEGALLLARAGLLDSHRATTHWSVMKCLERFPSVDVDASNPRFVVSGNRLTGGGVSSGLDEALKLISLLFGREAAEAAQVTTQYFPEPPVHGKIPPPPPCSIDMS